MSFNGQRGDRYLRRRLDKWGPLIGEEATVTYVRSRSYTLWAYLIGSLWAVSNIALEASKFTGVPIAVAAIICWPIILYCSIGAIHLSGPQGPGTQDVGSGYYSRPPHDVVRPVRWIAPCSIMGGQLRIRASRLAGALVGTSPKARPPVKNLEALEKWMNGSKYSRRQEPISQLRYAGIDPHR